MKRCNFCEKDIGDSNIRPFCGQSSNKKICLRCKKELENDYRFCPERGKATSGETVNSRPKEITIEEVKTRLEDLRERRKGNRASACRASDKDAGNNKACKSKTTYVLLCGVKRIIGGSWVQLKGKSSPSNHSVLKITFKKEANYSEVLSILLKEFKYSADTPAVLVDMNNTEILNRSAFTIVNYTQTFKKYVGSTRIYLGLGIKQTTQQDKSELVEEAQQDPPEYEVIDVSESLYQEAVQYLKQKEEFDAVRGNDVDQGGLADIDTSVFCPVYADNVKVQLFQNEKGYIYRTIDSGYGPFLCIPHTDMVQYDSFGRQLPFDKLFTVNAALLYYIYFVNDEGFDAIIELSKDVWQLNDEMANQYRAWQDSIIANFP